jgi:membrane associated rhomboid family serine protease
LKVVLDWINFAMVRHSKAVCIALCCGLPGLVFFFALWANGSRWQSALVGAVIACVGGTIFGLLLARHLKVRRSRRSPRPFRPGRHFHRY